MNKRFLAAILAGITFLPASGFAGDDAARLRAEAEALKRAQTENEAARKAKEEAERAIRNALTEVDVERIKNAIEGVGKQREALERAVREAQS